MMKAKRLGAATARFRAAQGVASPPDTDTEPEPHALDGEDFEPRYIGWEIARCAPSLDSDEQAALAALVAACVASIRAGSTRIACEADGLVNALEAVGGAAGGAIGARLVARARTAVEGDPVSDVVGRPGERKPLIVDGPWLYTERMHTLEERFCQRVRARASHVLQGDARAVQRAVAAVASSPQSLTEEQKRAVRAALGASLSLVTGGPGSGKTATAVAVVRAMAWLGIRWPWRRRRARRPSAFRMRSVTASLQRRRRRATSPTRGSAPSPSCRRRCTGCSGGRRPAGALPGTRATRCPTGSSSSTRHR